MTELTFAPTSDGTLELSAILYWEDGPVVTARFNMDPWKRWGSEPDAAAIRALVDTKLIRSGYRRSRRRYWVGDYCNGGGGFYVYPLERAPWADVCTGGVPCPCAGCAPR